VTRIDRGGEEVPQAPGSPLAARLDHLFKLVHPRDRGEYSYREVAHGIAESTGVAISPSYVWQLRMGQKDNPTKRHIEALAAFFGVAPSYFFDESESARVDSELAALASLRDGGVQAIALRATGLSSESLRLIADLIERTRVLEGLDRDSVPEE
jgi:transcriptional regulator with XRE-family HTH domain